MYSDLNSSITKCCTTEIFQSLSESSMSVVRLRRYAIGTENIDIVH